MKKALVLIGDPDIFERIKTELEKSGFGIEKSLSAQSSCKMVILDYFCLQGGLADELSEIKKRGPFFLIVKQGQMRDGDNRFRGLFRDIWVIPDNQEWDTRTVISALKGEVALQVIFETADWDFLPRSPQRLGNRLFSRRSAWARVGDAHEN